MRLPMWRFLIGQGNRPKPLTFLRLAFRLSQKQHCDSASQGVDLTRLTGDDIGQLIHRADQMGNAFFQFEARGGDPHASGWIGCAPWQP